MNDFPKDVKLAQQGDSQAFARLYALVYKDMYHIALYSLRNSHDACDAVSDAVLDAFSSIGNLRDENAFRKWIFKILTMKIKNYQAEYYSDTEDLNEINEPVEEFDYEKAELGQALDSLDPQSRLILSMSVLEGYTSEEISKICSLKSGSVRSRLKRIKERLKLELAEKF